MPTINLERQCVDKIRCTLKIITVRLKYFIDTKKDKHLGIYNTFLILKVASRKLRGPGWSKQNGHFQKNCEHDALLMNYQMVADIITNSL